MGQGCPGQHGELYRQPEAHRGAELCLSSSSPSFGEGGRKPTHLTPIFSLWTSVLTSAKAVSVVPSGCDKTDVQGC
jgi:hypothetical protein